VDHKDRVVQKSMDSTGKHAEVKTSHVQSQASSGAARVDVGKTSF